MFKKEEVEIKREEGVGRKICRIFFLNFEFILKPKLQIELQSI